MIIVFYSIFVQILAIMKEFRLILLVVFFVFTDGFSQQNPPSSMPLMKIKEGVNIQSSNIRDSIMNKFGAKSTKLNKNPDAKIEDYLMITHDYDTIVVDTSLSVNKYYKMNYLRRDGFELIPFSNTGNAYNTLGFNPKQSLFSDMGAKNKTIAYDNVEDVVYYDMPTPFTELMYRSVFEQGQILDAVYSVNTSRQFNFTITRKGLRSLGNYQNFITSSSNFKFITNYFSKNKKYRIRSHYANQKLFAEQNGGISNPDIENFENGVNQYVDRGVFDPNFENAHNEFLGKRFYVDQSYKLNKSDSLQSYKLKAYNSILFEEKQYKFQQSSLNDFFGDGFENQEINDKIFLKTLKFDAGLSYESLSYGNLDVGLLFIDQKYSTQNFEVNEFIDSDQSLESSSVFLNADYYKKINRLKIYFNSTNFISGDNKANQLKSKIGIGLKNENHLSFNFSFTNSPSDFNHRLYSSNYINYNWSNEYENVKTKILGLNLKLKRLLEIDFNYFNIQNHIQFEKFETLNSQNEYFSAIRPIQHGNVLDFVKIKFSRGVSFGKFSIDSSLLYQKSLAEDIVYMPEIVSRNTIYFSTDMFKKALYLQTGFGIKYFSKFYMNGYDPLLADLYIQRDTKIGNFPIIDFFINAKIQQTRLYFKFEHLNSSVTGYNFYSAPNYPYRDFTFRFGLVWNFFM